jgi:hypothetical protein
MSSYSVERTRYSMYILHFIQHNPHSHILIQHPVFHSNPHSHLSIHTICIKMNANTHLFDNQNS